MTRDLERFPEDDNGNVLWQMHQDGDDLEEMHQIEFSIVFTDQQKLEQCALHLLHQEQKVSFFEEDEESASAWVLSIHVEMIPDYVDILDLEEWVMNVAEQFGGEYDGWGCMAYVYDDEEEELEDDDQSVF